MYVMKCEWLGKLRKNTRVKNITVYFKLWWNTITLYNIGVNQGAVYSSRDYWVSGLCALSGILQNTTNLSLDTAQYKPPLWLQCVGDTFVVWPHGDMGYRILQPPQQSKDFPIQFALEIDQTIWFLFWMFWSSEKGQHWPL
jgi:hypothetical protein